MYQPKDTNGNDILKKYLDACCAPAREVSLKCEFSDPGGVRTVTGEHLISVELNEVLNTESSRVIMGATPSNSVKIKLFMPRERLTLDGGWVRPYAGLKIGAETVFVPLGFFNITEVSSADDYKTVEITAFDRMSKLTDTYFPNPAMAPVTPYQLFTYVCDGTETVGNSYFLTTDTGSYQFVFPAREDQPVNGSKLIFDTYDNTLHWDCFDGTAIEVIKAAEDVTPTGTNLSELFSNEEYHAATIANVLEDIADKTGISCEENLGEFAGYRIDVYKNALSYRELIGYIAGLLGKNAVFDREGKLTFRWYATAADSAGDFVFITKEMTYLDGFERTTESSFTINSVTSGTQENMLTSGNGYGISFTNPFMTQKRLDAIFEAVKDTEIIPCTLKYRAIPALECGDQVKYGFDTLSIMAQTLVLGKGMNATIHVYGESEASAVVAKAPTSEKLQAMYAGLQNAFKEAMETMVGVKGGYFELIYDEISGQPSGWRIMDTPVLTPNTNVWTMNKNGLYFSKNGGESVDNTAIDMDGNINANCIRTGTLNAERIEVAKYTDNEGIEHKETINKYISFENGNIILSALDSKENSVENSVDNTVENPPIGLRIERGKIAFYNIQDIENPDATPLAYFTNNSFSIEDIQKVQIGQFAFLMREHGNLTFTKVEE